MIKSVSRQYPTFGTKICQNIHIFTLFKVLKMECFINNNPVFLDGKLLCRRPESNRYGPTDRGILSPLRLPVPPLRHKILFIKKQIVYSPDFKSRASPSRDNSVTSA